MKYAFLLLACLGSYILTHAQISNSAADLNRIVIKVSNKNLYISVKTKETTVHSNEALDSCLQKIIPGLNHPSIFLDAPNDMDQEKLRAIGIILEKFHCPVMSVLKSVPANPPSIRKLDKFSH
jgi:hypothetical protein